MFRIVTRAFAYSDIIRSADRAPTVGNLLNNLLTIFLYYRLACTAFEAVFQKRQTRFGDLLAWLNDVKNEKPLRAQAAGLRGVVERYHR
jgi:hypothetical protein